MQINGQTCYTAAETAAKLGIAADTLKRQRQNGRISAIAVGRDYVYSDSEIRHYQIEIQGRAGGRSKVGQPAHSPTLSQP